MIYKNNLLILIIIIIIIFIYPLIFFSVYFLSNFQFSILNFESGCDAILPRDEGILKVPI